VPLHAARLLVVLSLLAVFCEAGAQTAPNTAWQASQTFETTFQSNKTYADPFGIEVDAIFTRGASSWRVPAFWRGERKWGVRFTPPAPGEYTLRLESNDPDNKDLNGHERRVTIRAYSGSNELLSRGPFKVSQNRRYFEHADGTPFYWLGDTWWTSLSDRLPWQGFQQLTKDRRAKGFTVVQLSVMAPSNEEDAPLDPGFCNEGGCVWDAKFQQLNPGYFDYADRRIEYLIDAGIAPVIVGAWRQALPQMGVDGTKKLWRYIVARYGAYPVFWVVGGEVYDPSTEHKKAWAQMLVTPGWTEVLRYIRSIDPYRHPVSVHELPAPLDTAVQDETLTDFDFFQSSHFGWAGIPTAIAQLNMHYARTATVKPLVLGETGWETFAAQHLEDFQRAAFWTAMLNGAAGFSYGNPITGESYNAGKPFHRLFYSFLSWNEGMQLPGATQVGLAARLLRKYPWQQFEPHPDWIRPRGTTILEPQSESAVFDLNLVEGLISGRTPPLAAEELPLGEWKKREGNYREPYAAGIPKKVRVIYIPAKGFFDWTVPTVLNLEPDVAYRAYYWEPTLGVKIDLGRVRAKEPGELIFRDPVSTGTSKSNGNNIVLFDRRAEMNVVASVSARSSSDCGMALRYRDERNYVLAAYSAKDRTLQLSARIDGAQPAPVSVTAAPELGPDIKLTAELRNSTAIVSITDGTTTVTSPIINIPPGAGTDYGIGLLYGTEGATQRYENFELRRSVDPITDETLERDLYDAAGRYRGALRGPHWDYFGKNKNILLNAYRPEYPPFSHDWVLVLEAI